MRELELLRQLAELQAQIRLVLEERFFKPVVTDKPRIAGNDLRTELSEDVVHFPTEGDRKAIEDQQKAEEDARKSLDDELAKIAEGHRHWREHQSELPTEAFAEVATEEAPT